MGAFSIFTSRKHQVHKETQNVNEYYEKIAKRIGILKYASLFMLIVLIIFGFTFYNSELTIENFRYMLKFMSIDSPTTNTVGTKIEYNSDENAIYKMLNGDMAILSTDGLQIYTMNNQCVLRDNTLYSDPISKTNGKHLIVTDRNSNLFKIYSAYSLLYEQKTKYPILDVFACNSGNFGIITSAMGYKSGIEIYDKEFRLIYKFYFAEKYIDSACLSDDGKTVCVSTITNNSDGDFIGGFSIFDISNEVQPVKTFSFPDEVAIYSQFFSDDSYVLVTNKNFRIYSKDGLLQNTLSIDKRKAELFEFSDDYFVVTFHSEVLSNAKTVEIYSRKGEYIMSRNIKNDVSKIDIIGNSAYLFSIGTLFTIDITSAEPDKTSEVGGDYRCMLEDTDNSQIIIVKQSTAEIYKQK